MAEEQSLIIVGASARAAAFSALRAGLKPWCIDLFADEDLRARCPVIKIPAKDYPHGLPELMRQGPPGPWMYTGGLENYPKLVERMARERELWGNGGDVLQRVRSPILLAEDLVRDRGVLCPEVRTIPPASKTKEAWLVKPMRGAGGAGIGFWDETHVRRGKVYYQRFIDGESVSAVLLAVADCACWLGSTVQLIGQAWLHASAFAYCGSIGPVEFPAKPHDAIGWIGTDLAVYCDVCGIIGIDIVLQEGIPWLIEVNPRYTASVELLEHATGRSFLAVHRSVFESAKSSPPPFSPMDGTLGKAIYFARESLIFPPAGPWLETLRHPKPVEVMPDFADIPAAGTPIARGHPVLTFFAKGDSVAAVEANLQRIAAELDACLYNQPGAL